MTSSSIISAVVARSLLFLQDESKCPETWRNGAKELRSGLIRINRLLKDADPEIKQRKKIFELEKKIVQLSYEIDDAISAAPNMTFSSKKGTIISSEIKSPRNSGTSSKPDLEILRIRLKNIDKRLQTELIQEDRSEQTQLMISNPVQMLETSREANIPAVPNEQENEVTTALLKTDLPVVCIWGESGMGKTTLAKKVFEDTQVIRQHFELFAWVPPKRDFRPKHVLQTILMKLLFNMPRKVDEIKEMGETELTQEIFTVLKEKKCLVVLEDIWDVQDWQSIRVAFHVGNSGSKILITTTSMAVAEEATSKHGLIYKMRPLTEAECLKMLRENASLDDDDLQSVGKMVFSLSGGSPLLALILGKSLMAVDVVARNQLLQELHSHLSQRSPTFGGATQVLALSYDRLPHELNPCLLYMGQFPIGKNIEAEKLYSLLSADGLILPEDSGKRKTISMESVRSILEKLSLRGWMVEAEEDKASVTRMNEYCRLHDQIRNFCISKGRRENLFEIVDFQNERKLRPSTRRLAIYLNKCGNGKAIPIFSSQDTKKQIRSLLIFDAHETQKNSTWPAELSDLKDFSTLRVLDFDGLDFTVRKVPRGIYKLVHLSYLSFRGCYLDNFPSYLANFPCLETLDLRVTPDCKMTIPNVLFNMKKLKHIYFPMLYQSTDGHSKLKLRGLERLEILVNFDTEACNIADLFGFKNLQILTTISEGRKNLEAIIKFLDEKAADSLQQSSLDIRNFNGYGAIMLKKLLQCKNLHSLHIEGSIGQIPKNVEISENFVEMVFNGSELESDPMNVLGKLGNLRSLTLSHDAFIGDEMTFSAASEFSSLRILKLLNLQYLEKLTFEQGALPKLSTLVINKCGRLKKVLMPKALDDGLRLAQEKEGDDVYLVEPRPAIINYDTLSGIQYDDLCHN